MASGQLIGVRRAGAPFWGAFNLRSPTFEHLLDELATSRGEIARLRTELVEALYRLVPEQKDRNARRALLRLKRDVHNGRLIADVVGAALTVETRRALDAYRQAVGRERALLAHGSHQVFAEYRALIARLLADELFRGACHYSSPALMAVVERRQPVPRDEFADHERGLYAYATKFISKANPFYTFAATTFPPHVGIEVDGQCEVIINGSVILDLERRLVRLDGGIGRRRLYLRPFTRAGESIAFFVAARDGPRRIALRRTPMLCCVIDTFVDPVSGQYQTLSANECIERMATRFGSIDRGTAQEFLRRLVSEGILVEYLVTDFDHFGGDLAGICPTYDGAIRTLERVHLGRVPVSELAAVHGRVAAALDRVAASAPLSSSYHVNRYGHDDLGPHDRLAREVCGSLEALKPWFCVADNFATRAQVIRAFVADSLAASGREAIPYLELLTHFLREHRSIVERYSPRAHDSAIRAWQAALRTRTGVLTSADLDAIPRLDSAGQPPSLCFNGPADYVTGRFYVTNVFAGGRRFTSRYMLHQRVRLRDGCATGDAALDVQLVPPFARNLNYVVRLFDAGCGFDGRHADRFPQWIDPSAVVVGYSNGRVIYRDMRCARELRFHHVGFQLAARLPAEYQLLLAHHTDFYVNPFSSLDSAGVSYAVRHEPALWYNTVCLRRERWLVPNALLSDNVLNTSGILRATVALREWVHSELGCGDDLWYYQARCGRPTDHKPTFLDLRNPLSVHAFRRAVAQLPAEQGVVALSPMAPSPAHLYRDQGAPIVTELMIEV